jgi:hypothetical protein
MNVTISPSNSATSATSPTAVCWSFNFNFNSAKPPNVPST